MRKTVALERRPPSLAENTLPYFTKWCTKPSNAEEMVTAEPDRYVLLPLRAAPDKRQRHSWRRARATSPAETIGALLK